MVDEYLEEIDRKQIADITKAKAKPPTPVGRNGTSAGKGSPKVKVVEEPVPAATPDARSFCPNRNGNDIPITAIRSADRCFLFHQENSSWVIRFQMHLQTKHRISALLSPVFTCRAFR